MIMARLLLTAAVLAVLVTPAAAQRRWIEARSPNFTVISDAGAGRARDIAWQFEQIREATARTFPWVRVATLRPVVVVAARDASTMRAFAPGLWDNGVDGSRFVTLTMSSVDRTYVLVRADVRIDDVEGVSPYQSAYWGYATQALADTSRALPRWLRRGLAEVLSNTLVREHEIQLGRVLPDNLRYLRSEPRMRLADLVSWVDDARRDRPESLTALDSHAWAFVHFLIWGEKGAHAPLLNKYVVGLLNGADATATLAETLGDVARFDAPLDLYIGRSLFTYAVFTTSARVARERFLVRDLTPVEVTLARGLVLAAADRRAEARSAADEATKLEPSDANAELLALLAEADGRDADLKAALERALSQPRVSWYVPYRLATLSPMVNEANLQLAVRLLEQSVALNPNADYVWAELGEARAGLGAADDAVSAAATAVKLVPSSSAHRLAQARTFQRLQRWSDAQRSAGLARALASTAPEREAAVRVLAEIARSMTAAATAAVTPVAGADAPVVEPALPAPEPEPSAVEPALVLSADTSIGGRINECYAEPRTCRASLPVIVADCTAGTSLTSTPACREAGYILDVGIGVRAEPVRAAEFYTLGCSRQDPLSCVRLATLRSLGRGVPRDAAAALAVLDPVCAAGTQEACYRLGLHLSVSGEVAERRRARPVLAASCDAGLPESCEALKKLPPPQ